jgi:hypothetical protein
VFSRPAENRRTRGKLILGGGWFFALANPIFRLKGRIGLAFFSKTLTKPVPGLRVDDPEQI